MIDIATKRTASQINFTCAMPYLKVFSLTIGLLTAWFGLCAI
jgi:hypothetical protein